MHQTGKAHPAIRMSYDEARKEMLDPHPSARRNGTGKPGLHLRIVAAPGGVAFVEDKPAGEGS